MEVEECICQKKQFHSALLDFIDTVNNSEDDFKDLIQIINDQKILQDKFDILELLRLISIISDNHHRTTDFFKNIFQIIDYIFQNQNFSFSNIKLFKIFESNKQILLHLFETKTITLDDSIVEFIFHKKTTLNEKQYFQYILFVYPMIKSYINEDEQKSIECEISKYTDEKLEDFIEKFHVGENDSYICTLIREDSIEDFISYINREQISINSNIPQSLFETNLFLLDKTVSLIEYAAFFGSIEIFQYLRLSKAKLPRTLWLYAIHSNNGELIHLLEENKVKPTDSIYEQSLLESIKCHHNGIAEYINDNLLKNAFGKDVLGLEMSERFNSCITNFHNYFYYPDKVDDIIEDKTSIFNIFRFKMSDLVFSVKTITIPSSVTEITLRCFADCPLLTKVIIPSSVKLINSYAFENCYSLNEISISSNDFSIGKKLFKGVESLNVTGDIYKTVNEFFNDCKSLKKVTLSPSITEIGKGTFSGCISLVEINIPSNLSVLGSFAFSGCSSLEHIAIPSSITSINDCTFYECTSLIEITIPSSVTNIGDGAFRCCSSLIKIEIPSSVNYIGSYAFYGCSSLEQIIINSPITCIKEYTFNFCESLTEFSIPSSVTSIEQCAFYDCSNLSSISIPSSVTSIGDYAFAKCISLKEISIPSSVTSIGENAFICCSSLEQITIPSSLRVKKPFMKSKIIRI